MVHQRRWFIHIHGASSEEVYRGLYAVDDIHCASATMVYTHSWCISEEVYRGLYAVDDIHGASAKRLYTFMMHRRRGL
jgi:hypothetical protein